MMERDVVRTQVYGAFGFLLHQLSTATQEDDTTMSEDDTTIRPPTNRVGATEEEWNKWIRESAEWEAAHPVPAHKPHEVCDCPEIPLAPGRRPPRGHCAAVGPIVPWRESTEGDTTMSEDDTTMSDADARAWSERTAARWRVQRAREGDITMEDGIGDGIRLIIDTPAGRIYDTTLIMAALAARAGSGEITPFLYRDPIDPDEPNAPRPLRRAVLAITDDKIVPTGLLGAEGAKGNEPEWSAWNDPNNP